VSLKGRLKDKEPQPAYIALGSNLHNPLAQLRQAASSLAGLGTVLARSSLYLTTPVGGPAGQGDYLNAVIALAPRATFADPRRLLRALLALEERQGRQRRLRWEARTLDLDLLAFADVVLDQPELSLPHPRMMARAFVLAPLVEVAPHWRHPVIGVSAAEALARLEPGGVEKTALRWQ
jgi:2-amino-4-hydroxy-6-hydroxymethyldihydropteridine diphosphokinase